MSLQRAWWAIALVAALFVHPVMARAADASPGVLAPKLQHLVDEQVMAGAVVLVADKDKVLTLEAVGYSDLAAKKPMQSDDLFWIASMTKSVTGAAMMMLVDEGRVGLDDPVEKYIPAFKDLKVAKKDGTLVPPSHPIKVREILSHTSGMRFLNAKDRQVIDSAPLEQSIEHDLLEPLLFDPGSAYQYSNEGIDTAGRIIEIVSGMPYEKFLQERLFTPLGMADTTFFPPAGQLARLAKTYQVPQGKNQLVETRTQFLKYPLDDAKRYPAPGGGLFSTARDVGRFCQMLANEGTFEGKTYLSKQALREMTSKQTGKLKDAYGLGIGAWGNGSFGHGGALKTDMWVDRGLVGVFLVQQGGKWNGADPPREFRTEANRVYRPGNSGSAQGKPPTTSVGAQVPTN